MKYRWLGMMAGICLLTVFLQLPALADPEDDSNEMDETAELESATTTTNYSDHWDDVASDDQVYEEEIQAHYEENQDQEAEPDQE